MVLLTGAAGGIGSACALAFARDAPSLVLVDRNASALDEVARQAQALSEVSQAVPLLPADVSDAPAVQAVVERAIQHFGRIDVLVNLAGCQGPGAPVWEVDPMAWRETLEANSLPAYLLKPG